MPKISYYRNAKDTKSKLEVEITDFLNAVKTGKHEKQVEKIRQMIADGKDDQLIKEQKELLPNACISGTFEDRSDSSIINHSGLIAIDLDAKDNLDIAENIPWWRQKLAGDQYTYAIFVTASSKGLCIIVKINPELHEESFYGLQDYYMDEYGLQIDKACKNTSRIRFTSYDPNMIINDDAETCDIIKKIYREKTDHIKVPIAEIEPVINFIEQNKIDVTANYDHWFRAGMCLATAYGENGRDCYHRISQFHCDYDVRKTDRKYDNYLKTSEGNLSMRSFTYILRKYPVPKALIPEFPKNGAELIAPGDDGKDINGNDKFDPAKELRQALIGYDEEIIEPPICLEVIKNDKATTITTLGNFSSIIGKAKSRKTFTISIATAAALKDIPVMGFHSQLPESKRRVIYFDTEQSKFHVQRVMFRIAKLAGYSGTDFPENIDVYSLRKYRPIERTMMIQYAVENTPGIGLVIIDGIRDLVTSINDEEESTEISTKIMRWTEELGIHIMTVLHQNKGDNFARGHLGTEIMNKAETIIKVTKEEKEPDVSVIESDFMRDKEFEPIAFTIDEDGIPEIIEGYVPEDGKKEKVKRTTFDPNNYHISTHLDMLEKAFDNVKELSYSAVCRKLQGVYGFGITRGKEFFKWYLENGYLYQAINSRYGINPEKYKEKDAPF